MTHDELIEAVAEELAEELGIRPWSEIAEDRGHLRSLVRAGANYDVNEPTKMDLRDMARAAIREIAPAVWQPVETAPEDGDMFVTDGTRVEVAFRDSGMSSYRFFSPATHSDLHFQPTHWMPVPALPSAP